MSANLLLWTACILAGVPGLHRSITAEQWVNQLSLRPGDGRPFVVLFFDLRRSGRALEGQVDELNRISSRRDVVVLAVTAGTVAEAHAFVERFKPRFAVGAQSTAYRTFGIKRIPQVVLLREGQVETIDDVSWLSDALGEAPPPCGDVPPEELPIDELQAHIEQSENLGLLELLRIRMPNEAFLEYCDILEQRMKEKGPAWLGSLRYQRHLADPDHGEKQAATTPGIDAFREARREGDTRRAELRELLASKSTWRADEVLDIYLRHLGDDPESLVYRSDWIWTLGASENPAFVPPLLDMFEVEPDAGIRSRITSAIGGIHTSNPLENRAEVAARLEGFLQFEDNIAWARPGLELTIELLRTHPTRLDTP